MGGGSSVFSVSITILDASGGACTFNQGSLSMALTKSQQVSRTGKDLTGGKLTVIDDFSLIIPDGNIVRVNWVAIA